MAHSLQLVATHSPLTTLRHRFPQPGEFVEWVEPYGKGSEAVVMRLSYEDVAKISRDLEPRCKTDQEAVEEFCVVHWGTAVVESATDAAQARVVAFLDQYAHQRGANPEAIQTLAAHGGEVALTVTDLRTIASPALQAAVVSESAAGGSGGAGQHQPMDAAHWAELQRLREEVKGPAGHASWKEAAAAERWKRVKAEATGSPGLDKLVTTLTWDDDTQDSIEVFGTEPMLKRLIAYLDRKREPVPAPAPLAGMQFRTARVATEDGLCVTTLTHSSPFDQQLPRDPIMCLAESAGAEQGAPLSRALPDSDPHYRAWLQRNGYADVRMRSMGFAYGFRAAWALAHAGTALRVPVATSTRTPAAGELS